MAIWKILGGKAVRFDEESGLSNIDDVTVNFSKAETLENISPTDTMKIILGKIMKWFSDLSGGAASTLLGQNLTANKVLVSDADGKVSASETDANEIVYFYGSSDEVNAALEAGELEAGANIYCEDDTEFEPSYNITEDRAVITNAEGEFAPSETTAQELEYLSGVTGNVQEQINSLNYAIDLAKLKYETYGIENVKITTNNYALYYVDFDFSILFVTITGISGSITNIPLVYGQSDYIVVAAPNGTTYSKLQFLIWHF